MKEIIALTLAFYPVAAPVAIPRNHRDYAVDSVLIADKAEQCNQLVAVSNQAVADIQAAADTDISGDNTAAMRQVVVVAEASSLAMDELALSDPQLQQFQQRFLQMYRKTGQATQTLITAAVQQDVATAEQVLAELQAATSVESSLVTEVNQYCLS